MYREHLYFLVTILSDTSRLGRGAGYQLSTSLDIIFRSLREQHSQYQLKWAKGSWKLVSYLTSRVYSAGRSSTSSCGRSIYGMLKSWICHTPDRRPSHFLTYINPKSNRDMGIRLHATRCLNSSRSWSTNILRVRSSLASSSLLDLLDTRLYQHRQVS
jgi:hypothetical protein